MLGRGIIAVVLQMPLVRSCRHCRWESSQHRRTPSSAADRNIACTVQPQPTYNNSSDPKRRAQSRVTCLTQSQQKRSTMSSSHMSPRSRTSYSISPSGKPPKPSKTPIGYSTGNGYHRPSKEEIRWKERKKPFRLCSPTWLYVLLFGARSDFDSLDGRLGVSCTTL